MLIQRLDVLSRYNSLFLRRVFGWRVQSTSFIGNPPRRRDELLSCIVPTPYNRFFRLKEAQLTVSNADTGRDGFSVQSRARCGAVGEEV